MKLIPIFSNGHGGVIGGVYQTAGKRSTPEMGKVLYEGAFNRWVVNRLIEKCDREGIPYYHVSPELEDVTLGERVRRIDEIYRKNKSTYLLEIHANAGGGVGIEGFTTKGVTRSDFIAEKFLSSIQTKMQGIQVLRTDTSDGDLDKEVDFYTIKNCDSPAVLLECGFMDNKTDYDKLWSESYLTTLVNTLFETIKELYNG